MHIQEIAKVITAMKIITSANAISWADAAVTIAKESKAGDLILTMGAGFVYKLHDKLKGMI